MVAGRKDPSAALLASYMQPSVEDGKSELDRHYYKLFGLI